MRRSSSFVTPAGSGSPSPSPAATGRAPIRTEVDHILGQPGGLEALDRLEHEPRLAGYVGISIGGRVQVGQNLQCSAARGLVPLPYGPLHLLDPQLTSIGLIRDLQDEL